tara:strand:- start:41539 stop:42060 length:522 start_codon:yes stop_codon:yes gene_type:complete
MPQASNVNNIVIHCSAGFGNREAIERFWYDVLKWRSPGYHRLIEVDGTIHKIADFSAITNGVRGYNDSTIHICYVGGVEPEDVKKARDTRNGLQKYGIEKCITEAVHWLKSNGKDITADLGIVGHRDFSKDGNANGVIESWERIKECPSFDVIGTLQHYLYSSNDRYNKLPYN